MYMGRSVNIGDSIHYFLILSTPPSYHWSTDHLSVCWTKLNRFLTNLPAKIETKRIHMKSVASINVFRGATFLWLWVQLKKRNG